MKYKAILFDLDGTLLPMDQDKFIGEYFKELTAYMCAEGKYDPSQYFGAIWQGVKAMLKNSGEVNNEDAYFSALATIYPDHGTSQMRQKYLEFYKSMYPQLKETCGHTEKSRELIDFLHSKDVKIALATNPVFPSVATNERMGWVGLKPTDFSVVTTCDNIGFSKPNRTYYSEVAKRLGVAPEECLMVGNDVDDDMVAKDVGMGVFLLTDCLINKNNVDISAYPHGGFDELKEYIKNAL